MKLDFRPSVIECRMYERGSYEEKSPYVGSFTVHVFGDRAEITLLTGICEGDTCNWSPSIDKQVTDYLANLGVKEISYEHKGKRIVRNT